jgi:hemerythrin-like domain-containing protein
MEKIDAIAEMRKDHNKVRDILLDLIDAIKRLDVTKAFELLLILDKLGGPHFRAEEEVMYPLLKKFFGEEYYNRLLEEHDRVIKAATHLAETLGKGSITPQEAEELIKLIQSEILPHPITCSGLEIFMERLSSEELDKIAESLLAARKEEVPLLEWSQTIRTRKV